VRHAVIGPGRIFTVAAAHPALISSSPSFGPAALAACALAGLAAGMLSAGMTASVYAAEDFFTRLPIHWMWWPALGGLVVGLGGLLCPQALGVGYDQIQALLSGDLPLRAMLLLGGVKLGIWSVSLGSGTSGGVLAPLLMLGAALGGILAPFLPVVPGGAFWPLVSMAAILAGTMRAPLTAVVFAMELTGRLDMLLPLLIASTVAHAFTVLALRRSILTEKMARRGFHVSREYAIDALEILFVREVMQTEVAAFPARAARAEASSSLARLDSRPEVRRQRLYPALDDAGALAGVVTRRDLDRWLAEGDGAATASTLASIARPVPVVAFADEPLRVVIHRMAGTGLTRLPVVDRGDHGRLLGLVSLNDMLKARVRHIEEEQRRERVLPLSLLMPFGRPGGGRKRSAAAPPPVAPEPRA
jgi:CBS domain-containing protein